MGLKDVVFIGLCTLGALAVAGGLLKRERIQTPRDYWPGRFVSASQPEPRDRIFPFPDRRASENDWQETRNRLDEVFAKIWKDKGLTPAPRASDLAIARRLSLGLTGTIPSLEEIRSLEQVPETNRLEWWVSHLLEDRRSADYLAERFARVYVGTDDGPFLIYRRRRFVSWLSEQFHQNRAYDEIVRELIADDGLWTSTPAVNFLTATANEGNGNMPDEIKLAGRVARGLLGIRIDCLQCHDDKLGTVPLGDEGNEKEGTQRHFHELAAFFGQAENSLTGIRDNRKEQYNYQFLNEKEKETVPPQVPFLEHCFSGHGDLRTQLANWVTHRDNKPFARATVNRVWGLLLGQPLWEPIDNIPLHGPRPAALDLLADDFIAHNYDLERLIRVIAASAPFQADSEADFEITPQHERAFAVFPLTRLRPEQVAGSIVQASWLQTIDADAHVIYQLVKFGQTRDFVIRYGDLGQDEFTDRGGTIMQRLLFMNGDLVKERLDENIVMNAATRLAVVCPQNDRVVEAVYLTVLTRRPTGDELTHFTDKLNALRGVARRTEIADLFWVLLNSTEYSWNH